MKKKILALVLLVTMTTGMITGCGSKGTEETTEATETVKEETEVAAEASTDGSGEKTELSFYIWHDEEAYITQVVDEYNASQDQVQVNLTVIPSPEYDDKLKVLLAGDSDVDLVDIRGMAQVSTYANSGALLDLTEKIGSGDIDTANYGEMWGTSSVDGKYYALPTRSTCWALYYNADLFDEAGIPYPEQLTWEEYGDLAKQLKDKLGVYGGYWVPWIYQFAAIQSGVYVDNEDTSKIAYSLELLNRFYNTDQSHMPYSEIVATNPDYISEFSSGRAAMIPNGEWCVQMLLEDEKAGETDINWQVAPMPVPEGVEPGTTWGQFQFAAITSTCKHPDEAYDFLQYLCGKEGSVVYSKNGMIHAYAGEEAATAYKEAAGRDSVSVFFDAKKIQEQPNTKGYDEIINAFNENVQLYLLGEKTIEETMENFSKQRDEIKAKNAES